MTMLNYFKNLWDYNESPIIQNGDNVIIVFPKGNAKNEDVVLRAIRLFPECYLGERDGGYVFLKEIPSYD